MRATVIIPAVPPLCSHVGGLILIPILSLNLSSRSGAFYQYCDGQFMQPPSVVFVQHNIFNAQVIPEMYSQKPAKFSP